MIVEEFIRHKWVKLFKENDIFGRFFASLYNGDDFNDFLFAYLHSKSILKINLLFSFPLTISVPNFRRHLSSAFVLNKLLLGKTYM